MRGWQAEASKCAGQRGDLGARSAAKQCGQGMCCPASQLASQLSPAHLKYCAFSGRRLKRVRSESRRPLEKPTY